MQKVRVRRFCFYFNFECHEGGNTFASSCLVFLYILLMFIYFLQIVLCFRNVNSCFIPFIKVIVINGWHHLNVSKRALKLLSIDLSKLQAAYHGEAIDQWVTNIYETDVSQFKNLSL